MKTIECWLVIIGVVILASSEEATIKAAGCDKLCRERQTFLNPTETGAKKYRFYNDSICQWCTRTNSLCKPQSTVQRPTIRVWCPAVKPAR